MSETQIDAAEDDYWFRQQYADMAYALDADWERFMPKYVTGLGAWGPQPGIEEGAP